MLSGENIQRASIKSLKACRQYKDYDVQTILV